MQLRGGAGGKIVCGRGQPELGRPPPEGRGHLEGAGAEGS